MELDQEIIELEKISNKQNFSSSINSVTEIIDNCNDRDQGLDVIYGIIEILNQARVYFKREVYPKLDKIRHILCDFNDDEATKLSSNIRRFLSSILEFSSPNYNLELINLLSSINLMMLSNLSDQKEIAFIIKPYHKRISQKVLDHKDLLNNLIRELKKVKIPSRENYSDIISKLESRIETMEKEMTERLTEVERLKKIVDSFNCDK